MAEPEDELPTGIARLASIFLVVVSLVALLAAVVVGILMVISQHRQP